MVIIKLSNQLIHMYIYINNRDGILSGHNNGMIEFHINQLPVSPLISVCDSTIKDDNNYSLTDDNSYIIYKYNIADIDFTSFNFTYFYINRNYKNDYYAYYINKIEMSNETAIVTLFPYSSQFYFDTCKNYYFAYTLPFIIGKNRVGYIDISFSEITKTPVTDVPTTQAPTQPPTQPTLSPEYNTGVATQSYLNNSYINVNVSYNSYIQ